jgi:predicted ATPase
MGWVLAQEGDLNEGIAHILRGQEMCQAIGARLGYLQCLPLLAETYRKARRVSEGLTAVDEALRLIREIGTWMDEPEVHRLKGELLLMRGEGESEVERCFQRAIDVARRQKARSWELRATASLCRLWQKQGRIEAARERLAKVYGWFTEGFESPDLVEARRLLEELGRA